MNELEDVAGRHLPKQAASFRMPWAVLSLILAILAAVLLGTLAVIVSINDVDTLSTVALALAVLAFTAQLIVSLAQASAAAQQMAQSERINADAQSALSEIRATSNSLLANQKELFAQVLRAALPEVARELSDEAAGSDEVDLPLTVSELESRLEVALSNALSNLPPALSMPLGSKYSQLRSRGDHSFSSAVIQHMYETLSVEEKIFIRQLTRVAYEKSSALRPRRAFGYSFPNDEASRSALEGLRVKQVLNHSKLNVVMDGEDLKARVMVEFTAKGFQLVDMLGTRMDVSSSEGLFDRIEDKNDGAPRQDDV